MLFKIEKKKTKIKSFLLKNDKLIFINELGIFIDDDLEIEGVKDDLFTYFNNRLIFVQNSSTYIGDKKIEKSILLSSLHKSVGLFSSELNLEKYTLRYELINLDNLSIIHDFGHLPFVRYILISDEQIIIQIEHKILSISADNFSLCWELEKSLKKVLGLYQNQLLVVEDDHVLLSIDTESGEIMFKWNELPGFQAGSLHKDVIPNATNFVLDKEKSKLIGVFHTYYFEIDLVSKNIVYYQLKEELSKHGISDFRPFNDNPFTAEHLFLTAHTYLEDSPKVDLSSVLALNRQTKKVDWCHTFKESGLGTNIPQITSTHLYQKDLEGNLHVFKKQDQFL